MTITGIKPTAHIEHNREIEVTSPALAHGGIDISVDGHWAHNQKNLFKVGSCYEYEIPTVILAYNKLSLRTRCCMGNYVLLTLHSKLQADFPNGEIALNSDMSVV